MSTTFADHQLWALSSNTQRLESVQPGTETRQTIVYAPAFSITNELQFGNRRFILRKPISVQTEFRDGLWIHESPELSLLAYAPTRAESLNSFCMDFAAIWDQIAQEPDEALSGDALQLKRKLLELVETAL